MAYLAQNEMKARHATPLRVRLTDGLGRARRSSTTCLAFIFERKWVVLIFFLLATGLDELAKPSRIKCVPDMTALRARFEALLSKQTDRPI